MKDILLTQDALKQIIEYDPILGTFYRLPRPPKIMADTLNNTITPVGPKASNRSIFIDGVAYNTLDICWLYHYGKYSYKQLSTVRNSLKLKYITQLPALNEHKLPTVITQELVHQLLCYNGITGQLHWRKITQTKKQTGFKDYDNGNMSIFVNGNFYQATHIAFLYMTGDFPLYQVRRKNKFAWDYRWDNLYEVLPERKYHN
jgi:hypothetical protein